MAPDIVDEESRGETESIHSRSMYPVYPSKRNLREESEREKTYTNWPVRFLDSKSLAKQGFYYTNNLDVVKCAFCDIEIGCWEEGDVPENDHKRLSPRCPLVKGETTRNPVVGDGREETRREETNEEGESRDEGEEDETRSQDVCGPYGLEIRPFSGPERPNKVPLTFHSNTLWRDFEHLGVSRISGPVSPYYATYSARIKTYENWTKSEIQSPEKLAEAGFYYTSFEDNVLCFHCGGGLKNWEVEDEPWVEHARWFSRCPFVLLCKGKEFVQEVLAKSENGKETPSDPPVEQEKKKKEQEEGPSTPSATPSVSNPGKEPEPNSEGKDMELCRICYAKERRIVFLPCGHLVSCPECAACLSNCAVCRKPFEATVRVYFS